MRYDSGHVRATFPVQCNLEALEIRLIASLPAADRGRLADVLGVLDYRVAGAVTGAALIESHVARAPRMSWAVFLYGEPVGAFALVPYQERPGALQTSTYLAHSVRGAGVNLALKRATVLASRRAHQDVYSSIAEGNARSLAAASKLFLSYEPGLVFEVTAGRTAWLFELSDTSSILSPGPVASGLVDALAQAMGARTLKVA